MKFKDYKFMINEASATDSAYYERIDFDEMVSLYKKHCTNDNIELYRGTKSDHGTYNIIEGQKGGRRSENTSNHYTVFLDELIAEENKSYPLRSKSIIATTQKSYAKKFGNLYNVIPFDDTWIGIVPSQDIWDIEVELNNGKYLGIQQLNEVFMKAGVDAIDISDAAYQIENEIDDEDYDKHLSKVFGERKDIEKKIREIYSLSKLGLKFVQAKDYKGSEGEVWIGGKCLIIEYEQYDKLIDVLNSKDDGSKILFKKDEHYNVDMFADEYVEYADDEYEPTRIDLSKLKIIDLGYTLGDKISTDDFFKLFDKHVKQSEKEYYAEIRADRLENMDDPDRVIEYIKYSDFEDFVDCLDIDGFKAHNDKYNKDYEYFIFN